MSSEPDHSPTSDRLKSHQLIARMSHELRSPLNPIIGFSQLLLDGLDGDLPDDAMQDIRAIYGSAQTLLMLLDVLIDWAKLENDSLTLHLEEHSLCELVEAFVRQEVVLQDARITVEMPSDGDCTVSVEKSRLRQVLRYIIQPLLEHTKTAPITVACSPSSAAEAQVTISGFADEQNEKALARLAKVLDILERQQLTEADVHGEVLALYVAQHLIQLHGGKISLNRVDAKPQSISFVLPISSAESE